MALVEAARFLDRHEAFIARAALLNADIYADVRDNGYANMIFGVGLATGGYGVLVDEGDERAARELISEFNAGSQDALNWSSHPENISAIPLAALGTLTGFVVGAPTSIGARRPRKFITIFGTALAVIMIAGFITMAIVFWAEFNGQM
jgi:hypothetical protein